MCHSVTGMLHYMCVLCEIIYEAIWALGPFLEALGFHCLRVPIRKVSLFQWLVCTLTSIELGPEDVV